MYEELVSHTIRLHNEVSQLRTEIAVTNTHLERLVGNGQPGEIALLDGRVKALEDTKNVSKGVLAAAGVIWTGLVGLIEVWFHRAR